MIQATRIEKDCRVNFEWDDVKFNLKYLSIDEIKRFHSDKPSKGFRQSKKNEVDIAQFSKSYTRHAIKGWENLKYKDLPEICPGFIFEESPEAEIEYSEENLNFIAENSGVEFQEFLITANSEIPKIVNQKKEDEVKNF